MTQMRIETDQETDGCWIGEVPEIPGALAYGSTRDEGIAKVQALALRAIADRLEHGDSVPAMSQVFSVAA
jgi:predicted RNase H-like HicB family nuclease